MIKKFICFFIFIALMTPTFSSVASVITPNDTIFYRYKNIELRDLDIKLDKKGEIISKIKDNSITVFNLKQKNTLDNSIKENESVKKTIKENLINNKEMIGLSYTEYYIEEKTNENGEIHSKLLTIYEVNKLNRASVNPGVPAKRGKLTLVSNLITDQNLVGKPNTYAFSANANWDFSDSDSNGKASPSKGYDFIGLCWPSSYKSNGTYIAKGFYNNGNTIAIHKSSFIEDSGIVWSFKDKSNKKSIPIGSTNISVAAQIVPQCSKEKVKTFSAEYVHTYDNKPLTVDLGLSSKTSSGGLAISSSSKYWTIVSPVTVRVI